MGFTQSSSTELSRTKRGLFFDSDAVTLIGRFGDELGAYRARKAWVQILSSYFLLENDRDYEFWVSENKDDGYFALSCCFTSACGRYAFWRIINHQAPEAEDLLMYGDQPPSAKRIDPSEPDWLLKMIEQESKEAEENATIIKRLLRLFT